MQCSWFDLFNFFRVQIHFDFCSWIQWTWCDDDNSVLFPSDSTIRTQCSGNFNETVVLFSKLFLIFLTNLHVRVCACVSTERSMHGTVCVIVRADRPHIVSTVREWVVRRICVEPHKTRVNRIFPFAHSLAVVCMQAHANCNFNGNRKFKFVHATDLRCWLRSQSWSVATNNRWMWIDIETNSQIFHETREEKGIETEVKWRIKNGNNWTMPPINKATERLSCEYS